IIVKKNGDVIKAKVTDIGTDEIKFKLNNDTDGPTISIKKSEIKTLKVGGQIVIEDKTGSNEAIITKKDGSIIKAKISEMGTDEIKFKLYNNPDGPTMSLKKFDIKSIKIDGQTVYEYKEDPLSATNHSIIDKTSTFKFYFLSPINRHIAFGYEWMYKPGFNWDVALGVIGPGIISTTTKTAKGLFFRAGPKFLLGNSSDIETGDGDIKIRYAHPLKGKYIKVEAILNAFSTTHTIDTGGYSYYNGFSYYTSKGGQITYKNRYQALTLNLQFGKQYIFGNAMTFAWYFGFGYSFENKTSDLSSQNKIYDVFDFNRYSHTYFGKSLPMVFTWGITIGYILRAPDWLTKGSAGYDAKPSRHYKEGVQIK
ncbi:MAG: hypothetical protein HY840_05710, partial [Bacteroidetes bacterium]|nr:hypothetical protein [Bacteroidota bacterium]